MINQFIDKIKENETNWVKVKDKFIQRDILAKTVLLAEGEVPSCVYFIKKGCLRMCFNKDGEDITFQFFFEGQAVASIDSLLNNKPSMFTIESIEPSTIISISKVDFYEIHKLYPELKDEFQNILFQRFRNYAQLFLSRIKDTPKERYDDLVINHPEIIRRIPQHYIASYLGITPVSLSRIRNRK